MAKIYFYCSSRKSDKCSQITIMSSSELRAYGLAVLQFKKYNYKGTPKRIAI